MVMSAESDAIGTVDVLLKAVADPLRMQILKLLAREALCTSHLVEETGAKQTNLSNHLKILREAGLVDTEPCGRFTYYKLRPDALESLAGFLGDLAATARATACADTKRSCP